MIDGRQCLAAVLTVLVVVTGRAAPGPDDPDIQRLLAAGTYDQQLCATAQRVLLNADAGLYETSMLVAEETFVVEQMATDADSRTVTVASLTEEAVFGRDRVPSSVACKMVNQPRVETVLQLDLPEPAGACIDVNRLTYAVALNQLSRAERERFLGEGAALVFIEDYAAPAGGAWLASTMSDYIGWSDSGSAGPRLIVQAPSVQVEWPGEGGDWFQGTHHCKLITLAAMTRWMKQGAFDGSRELYPRPKPKCVEPDSRTSVAGSCLQYFGPAGAQFCQDYSGSSWTRQSAREDCAIRHASLDVWNSASESYDGGGGVYSELSCAERGVAKEAGAAPVNQPDAAYKGTCVFRCNTPDEALWHQLTAMPDDPDGTMLAKTCDLYLEIDW